MPQSSFRPPRCVGRNHPSGVPNDVEHLHVGEDLLGPLDLEDRRGVFQKRYEVLVLRTTPTLQHAQQNTPKVAPVGPSKRMVEPSPNVLLRKLERQAVDGPDGLLSAQRRSVGLAGGP